MTAWFASHWSQVLGAWLVTHAVAQTVSAKAPAGSWYGKLAHVWAALNPLDVVKAWKAVQAGDPAPAVDAVQAAAQQLGGGK